MVFFGNGAAAFALANFHVKLSCKRKYTIFEVYC